MGKKPIYTLTFSRDFSLPIIETWGRAETVNDKIWTENKQPYLPYVICEKTERTVNVFYNHRGIDWVRNELIKKANEDKNFFARVEKTFTGELAAIGKYFVATSPLSTEELKEFLFKCEKIWVWFEAAWWLWEIPEDNEYHIKVPEGFREMRKGTQDFVPKADEIVRKSLSNIYPNLKELAHVISCEEVQTGKIAEKNELEKRSHGYFCVSDKLVVGKDRAYVEDKYSMEFEVIKSDNVTELKGQTAYKGKVRGTVKVMLGLKEMEKVREGDILVSSMTMPDFLPAMKKAAAFVTDEGGIACHAAIMARELHKVCIVGTKIATRVLKDGDLVEVDAEKGIVRIIK